MRGDGTSPPTAIRIREVSTSAARLGFHGGGDMKVDQLHLEGAATLDDAVAAYRRTFGLSDHAWLTVTRAGHRITIDAANEPTIVTTRRRPHPTSTAMVVNL